jgi:hypothetical protein
MRHMNTSSGFDQLLAAASAQADPQVLLFVFAGAELPSDATPAQRRSFERGVGGELTPLMCVEKELGELSSFEALVSESREVGPPWQVVFAAGLAGANGRRPSGSVVEQALNTMVDRVRHGTVHNLLALSPTGEVLTFS